MLTPLGLWDRLRAVGASSVEASLPDLDRQGGELLLAIAGYRAGERGDLLGVSRAVDDYCAHALTAAEVAVQVGVMSAAALQHVRAVVQSLAAGMQEGRILAARPNWDPSSLFVGLDVDGMPDLVAENMRSGIKLEGDRNAGWPGR